MRASIAASAYEFIKAHRDRYSVQMTCRVLEEAVSGYYDWLKQPISNHAQEDARLFSPDPRLLHRKYFTRWCSRILERHRRRLDIGAPMPSPSPFSAV
jgi:hypothetical protein